MERAIKERDQHCVWPGCTQSRHLHIHHIKQNDLSQFDFATSEIEKALRNSKESFNVVRKLSPKQYRFRIVDAQGKDILDQSPENIADTKQWPT